VHALATIDGRPDLPNGYMLHDLEDASDMEDPGDAGVDLRVDNVSNNVEDPHAIPEALEMNDTNADLSGVSDTTAVETRGMNQTDAIREVTPDSSPDVHSASDQDSRIGPK